MKARVFVVEDEIWVRRGILFRLRNLNDSVEIVGEADGFNSAREALAQAEKIDALFTDIVLPDGCGLDLIDQMRSKHPELKAFIISGYSKFEYAHRAIALGVSGYILKPLAPDALDEPVRMILRELLANQSEPVNENVAASIIKNAGRESNEKDIRRLLSGCEAVYDRKAEFFQRETAALEAINISSSELMARLNEAAYYYAKFSEWLDFATNAVQEMLEQANMQQSKRLIVEIKNYISIYYRDEISLETLSKKFGISPAYLSRLFKNFGNEGFSEYLARVRINAACKLLRETQKSINEVSEELNFWDSSYFSKIFKRYTGVTPSQYKRTVVRR